MRFRIIIIYRRGKSFHYGSNKFAGCISRFFTLVFHMHDNRSHGRIFRGCFDGVAAHGDADRLEGLDLIAVFIPEADIHCLKAACFAVDSSFDRLCYSIHIRNCGEDHCCPGREGTCLCRNADRHFRGIRKVSCLCIAAKVSCVNCQAVLEADGRVGLLDCFIFIFFC